VPGLITKRFRRSGAAGLVAITAIVALGSACLAGSPLYLSSVATAALQSELAHTCLADVGVRIPMRGAQPDVITSLEHLAAPLAAHTQPSVLTRIAPSIDVAADVAGARPIKAYLVYRTGQAQNLLRSVKAPRDGEVLAPEGMNRPRGTSPGDVLTLSVPGSVGQVPWKRLVSVADTYPPLPTRPEPAYWCGLRSLLRSSSNDPADPPTPVLFTTSREIRTAQVFRISEWELRPNTAGLTRHDAAVLADRFDEIAHAAHRLVDIDEHMTGRTVINGEPLRAVVRHAGASTAVVAGTMAPVRLVALLSSLTLLGAATALLTRERQRELRLRLLKGQSPWLLGFRVARTAAGAVAIGTVVGGGMAWAAVHYFGPAAELEPAAVHSAILGSVIGSVTAFLLISCVATVKSRTLIDGRSRHRSLARFAPWELIPVAAAIAMFARLDRFGGIQQAGAAVGHADFWAQCFPLLAIIAPLAVLARPTTALLRRWRLAGARFPPAVLTGIRRSLAEPGVTAAVLLATALAAGSFTLARLLTDSTSVLLSEKAAVFLGGDLSLATRDVKVLPPPFDNTGTVVTRSEGHSGSQSVDLLGIDPATFARGVHWRNDAADRSLEQLVAAVQLPGGQTPGTSASVPAIVVGGSLPDTHLVSATLRPMDVRPVATARWFPGLHNGAVLVVVDKAALVASGMATRSEIWLRDPPPDAVARLTAAGLIAGSPRDLSQVFNVTSFLTVRWAYATLSILGALVGIVVLLAQLLVLDARRQTRQAAHVLTTRMGLTSRGEAVGLVAELAPALAGGAILGVLIGWLVTRISIARLDSLRQLRPPARVIAHPAATLPVVGGVVASLAVLVVVGVVMIKHTRVMEVMRGTA
jgi:putative ABC transport system permease protein